MSSERASRLAATRAPTRRYSGKGASELRNLASHQVASRKYVRRDPGARALQREIDVWSSYKGPGIARQGRLKVLSRHVDAAEKAPVTLYRGMALPTRLQRGQVVDFPMSSFTADPAVARRFAAHRAKQVGGKPQVLEVKNARALHVSPLARRRGIGMSEWVGQGQFRVTRGGQMARLVPVSKGMPGGVDLSAGRGLLRAKAYKTSTLVTRQTRSGNLVQTRRKAHLG